MKFGCLGIENFLAIGRATIDLKDRGLISIEGVNEDDSSAVSNGAGKSSIADALCWCLYGATARGVTGDAIVNKKAGKNTRVSVNISDGDRGYFVQRFRKHKDHKNVLQLSVSEASGFWANITQGTDKLTQELVEKVIGCSYEVFRSSIYAGQEQMPDLPGMTDKQLKMLVEEAAGVTILENAYELARDQERATRQKLGEAMMTRERLQERQFDVTADITSITHLKKAFHGEQKAEAKKLIERAKELAGENKLLQANLSAMVPKATLHSSIKAINAQFKAISAETVKERELESAARQAAAESSRAFLIAQTKHKEFKRLRNELENVKERVGKPCGECGKPYCDADIAKARVILERTSGRAKEDHALALCEHGNALQAHKNALHALETHRATMTDVAELSAQRASIEAQLKEVEALEQCIAGNKAQIERYKDHANQTLKRPNPHEAQLETLEERLRQVRTSIVEALEQEKNTYDQLVVDEALIKVFSPAGVRAHILDTVTPYLNAQTAKYLSTLSDGNIEATWSTLTKTAKGELREKFAIEVCNSKGGESFGLISGGEKRKVRIACALALQDLVSSRATKPIELFIGDEIDDALDAAGLERLMIILQEKARERGSVFVISHNSGIRDWISNTITVVRKGGVSTLEETA